MVPIRIFASKFPNVQYGKIGIIIIVMSTNLDLILALAKVATNYTAVCCVIIYSYIMIQRVSRPYCPEAYFAILFILTYYIQYCVQNS